MKLFQVNDNLDYAEDEHASQPHPVPFGRRSAL